ncbi:ATP-binding protein, partial [Candidatus Margulisiibacteriota bacterium]
LNTNKIRWFLDQAKAKRSFPADKLSSVKTALVHLNLLQDNKPTNAAICLFGKNVKKFHLQAEVKCIQFYGTEIEKPFASYKIYGGNLFDQIDQAITFVVGCLRLPVVQQRGTAQVSRPLEIPEFVISEAVVNAVAHRDYNSSGAVQVMVFSNRIEIWNPGRLSPQLTIAGLKKPHTSYPYNPLVAEILYLADYIQKAGSGTVEMIKQCRASKIPDPRFTCLDKEFRVSVERKPVIIKSSEKGSEKSSEKILSIIKINPQINALGIAGQMGLSSRAVEKNIAKLKRQGLLRRIGSARGGYWKVLKK